MAYKTSYSDQRRMEIVEHTRSLLSELPNDVYDYILAISDSTQPLTRLGYVRDLRLFFTYLQKENPKFSTKPMLAWTSDDFALITARDITMFLDYLTLYFNEADEMLSNHELGKQRKFYSVRAFFKWMYKQQKLKNDVTALVDAPKRHEKPILRLDIEEVKRLLKTVADGEALSGRQKAFHRLTAARDLAMVTLLLGTGIRVSECAGLDIDDVNLENGSFLVTRKGGNQAILYLPDEVLPVMRDYMDVRMEIEAAPGDEQALFLSLQKRRMNIRSIQNMVKKYAAIAAPLKKRISPHKLRSTFGTNLYNETGDIYLVADQLGHSDINTTRRHYAAMSEDRRRMAASHVHLGIEPRATKAQDDTAEDPDAGSE